MSYVSVQDFQNSVYFDGLQDYFTDNTQISGFLDDVVSIIDNYCGRSFVTGNYTDEFIGGNTGTYFTRNFPLQSLTSIDYVELSSPTTTGTLILTNLTFTDKGCVKYISYFSPTKKYTMNYIAGYQTPSIPRPIKTATMMLAKHMADAIDTGNVGSPDGAALAQFKFGKFTETYVAGNKQPTGEIDNLPPAIAALLKRYRYTK